MRRKSLDDPILKVAVIHSLVPTKHWASTRVEKVKPRPSDPRTSSPAEMSSILLTLPSAILTSVPAARQFRYLNPVTPFEAPATPPECLDERPDCEIGSVIA